MHLTRHCTKDAGGRRELLALPGLKIGEPCCTQPPRGYLGT